MPFFTGFSIRVSPNTSSEGMKLPSSLREAQRGPWLQDYGKTRAFRAIDCTVKIAVPGNPKKRIAGHLCSPSYGRHSLRQESHRRRWP